jgi:hypothetical protein
MDRIILVLVAIAMGVSTYFFYNKSTDLAGLLEEQKIIESVVINSSVLSEVKEFTFSKISTQFNYVHEKSGALWVGVYEYSWVFNYHFGFKIPESWDWKFKDHGNGEVSLSIPEVSQLNDYEINAQVIKRIKKANGKHSIEMQNEVNVIALEKVKAVEIQYLSNDTVIKSTKRSLEAYFLSLLNQVNPERATHKVTINTVKL